MNQEIKARWVSALRSGKYEQGQHYLCEEGKFCCLGVLCDIVKDDLGLKWELFNNHMYIGGSSKSLGNKIADYCGLLSDPLVDIGEDDNKFLTVINDKLGYDFNEIADLIEAQV
jgi:hypothetical protein